MCGYIIKETDSNSNISYISKLNILLGKVEITKDKNNAKLFSNESKAKEIISAANIINKDHLTYSIEAVTI